MTLPPSKRVLPGLVLLGLWALCVRLALFAPRLEVEVEMASEAPGTLQLFVDDGGGFREGLSARSAVAGGGRLETHRLEVEVGRAIRALRLDPVNAAGLLTIRSITVSFAGRAERFEGASLAEWQPGHQLSRSGDMELESLGTDPWLVRRGDLPLAAPWRRLARPFTLEESALVLLALPLLALGLREPRRRWAAHALALATPIGFFLTFNLRALNSWWIRDDPCLLASALESGAGPHFWRPEVWRALSGSVLMPWTPLSFAVDARLFGLEPAAFYAHQLVAFGVLLAAAYGMSRSFLSAFTASAALSFFAILAPSFAVAQQLMNRHYLEGLILFLGALALYLRAVRTDRLGLAVAGAVLYLLATTAKEVFVPLAAVLLFLPAESTPRSRLCHVLPFGAAAALYAPWRLYMLGWANSLSGYAERPGGSGIGDVPSIVGLGNPWPALLAALLLSGAAVLFVRRSLRRLGLAAVVAAVLGLPLAPVLAELAPRHFLLPSLAAAALFAAVAEPWLAPRRTAVVALSVTFLAGGLFTLTRSPIHRQHGGTVEHYRAEGGFLLEGDDAGVLFSTLADSKYLACVDEIRHGVQGTPGGPGFCGDACWCSGAFPGVPAWRYVGGRLVTAATSVATSCAEERELRVTMEYDRGAGRLTWRMGPYEDGAFHLLLVTGEERAGVSVPVPLAAAGEAPLALAEPFRWIVKYRSPEGWQTYSPVLTLDPAVGRLDWERQPPMRNISTFSAGTKRPERSAAVRSSE